MKLYQLSVGSRVKELYSGVVFLVAAQNHTGYGGTTLITDHVIMQGAMDAPEPENPDERVRVTGNNYYPFSNLHQWLNSCGENWYQPAHTYDAPPTDEILENRPTIYDPSGRNSYAQKKGFLSWFSPNFRDGMLLSKVPCLDADQSGLEYIDAYFFAPSAAEVGVPVYREPEGEKFPLFDDFRMRYASPDPESMKASEWQPPYYAINSLFWYWMRTPKGNDTGFSYYVHNIEPFSYKFSCMPWMGIRPCVNMDGGMNIALSERDGQTYLFIGEE